MTVQLLLCELEMGQLVFLRFLQVSLVTNLCSNVRTVLSEAQLYQLKVTTTLVMKFRRI